MAPEQVKGQPVDRTADIWGLGVVLWQLLARKRLFEGKELMEIMNNVLYQEIKRPSEIEPAVPPELDDVCLKGAATRQQRSLPERAPDGR